MVREDCPMFTAHRYSKRAWASFVFGCLAWFFGALFVVFEAWVFLFLVPVCVVAGILLGSLGLRNVNRSDGTLQGRGSAKWGIDRIVREQRAGSGAAIVPPRTGAAIGLMFTRRLANQKEKQLAIPSSREIWTATCEKSTLIPV
jgi:hypothetical protein